MPDHNLKCEKKKRFTPASQSIISPQVKFLFGGKPIITELKKPVVKSETISRVKALITSEFRPASI